jgi:hypothetical protein
MISTPKKNAPFKGKPIKIVKVVKSFDLTDDQIQQLLTELAAPPLEKAPR